MSIIIGGFVLHYITDPYFGFAFIFLIAILGGVMSWLSIKRCFEPNVEVREPREYGFFQFVREIRNNNFGIFTLFISFMYFGMYIASPLFVLYWLRVLNFSYLQYMILLASAAIAGFITIAYWGTHADHYGNKQILQVSSYLVAIVPIIWMSTHFLSGARLFYLAVILQVIGGFGWAGFNISSANFIFDNVRIEDRVRKISYFNALKGISIFLGSMVGAVIIGLNITSGPLSILFSEGFMIVLAVSFVARFFVTTYFMKFIKEVKEVKKQPKFLHFVTVMPVQGMIFDSIVGMNRTLKRFKERLLRVEKSLDYWEEDYKKKTGND